MGVQIQINPSPSNGNIFYTAQNIHLVRSPNPISVSIANCSSSGQFTHAVFLGINSHLTYLHNNGLHSTKCYFIQTCDCPNCSYYNAKIVYVIIHVIVRTLTLTLCPAMEISHNCQQCGVPLIGKKNFIMDHSCCMCEQFLLFHSLSIRQSHGYKIEYYSCQAGIAQ